MNPPFLSLYYKQPKHAVSVRGALTPVLTIWRLKASVSPPEIHSVNRPNLIFLPVRFGNYHRTIIIIHKQQSEKGRSTQYELTHMYLYLYFI